MKILPYFLSFILLNWHPKIIWDPIITPHMWFSNTSRMPPSPKDGKNNDEVCFNMLELCGRRWWKMQRSPLVMLIFLKHRHTLGANNLLYHRLNPNFLKMSFVIRLLILSCLELVLPFLKLCAHQESYPSLCFKSWWPCLTFWQWISIVFVYK